MMEASPVRLALVFDDPVIEKAFKDSIGRTRRVGDALMMSLSTVVFATFYMHGVYDNSENTVAQFLWLCSTLVLAALVGLTTALLSGHHRVLHLKPFLMLPVGICGNVAVKLMASSRLYARKFDGSLLRGVQVVLMSSRAVQPVFSFGLWSTTGSTFLVDLALMASMQALNVIWNRADCELLCEVHPSISAWFSPFENVLEWRRMLHPSRLLKWTSPWATSAASDPVRGCVYYRLFMQVMLGGCLPMSLAYWREMKERAAFLKSCKVAVLQPTIASYVWDGLLACSVVVMSTGFMTALLMAVPELYDFPVMLTKGHRPGFLQQ